MKQAYIILGLLLPVSTPAMQTAGDWDLLDDDLEARISAVSDGELTLLDKAPQLPAHHHRNLIRITAASLQDGWVTMEQCHSHLDPVAEAEIVYHPQRIRNIRLLDSENIQQTRIEASSVQLRGIEAHARLCLQVESRALVSLRGDAFRLKNGPFMRRFLDGYYPMRVSLEISYPASLIKLQAIRPLPGHAGSLQHDSGQIVWDSWFKGRLFTEFDFQQAGP